MSTLVAGDTKLIDVIDVEESEQEKALDSVLGELGVENINDIMLKVYRVDNLGKDAHCFDCLPDAINGIEEQLKKSYGEGDYKIKVFAPISTGGKAVKKVIKLSVALPIQKEEPEKSDSSPDLTGLIMSIQNSNTQMITAMREMQMEQTNKNQEMMINILTSKKDEPSLIEQLTLLKSLIPEPPKPVDPLESVLKMMEVQAEVKSMVEPQEKSELGLMAESLSNIVNAAVNAPNKKPEQNLKQNTEEKPENKGENMNFIIKQQISKHLELLCQKASQDKPVDLWVDMTISEVPENYHGHLINALGADDDEAFKTLVSINHNVGNYKDWFMAFVIEMRSAFSHIYGENNGDDVGATGELLTNDTDKVHDDGELKETIENAPESISDENDS